MVLWGNFSYSNSNNWKKFYRHFTQILCNTVGRRKLRSNPSCAQLTQWNHELTKLMLISIGNLTSTLFLGVGVGVWPYPNPVGDCWGLTTPLPSCLMTYHCLFWHPSDTDLKLMIQFCLPYSIIVFLFAVIIWICLLSIRIICWEGNSTQIIDSNSNCPEFLSTC